ncbi:hypothetical protein GCM10027162_08250 [Streptomyces incanus]
MRHFHHSGPVRSHEYLIDEAPAPVLSGLMGPYHGVARFPVVPRRVPSQRRVAAADVTAAETQAQLHRIRAVPQTLRTRLGEWDGFRERQRVGVRALFHDGQITTVARITARRSGVGTTWT